MMKCLEIGVGTDRSYKFAPKTPINCTTVFVDIEAPSGNARKHGMWVVADAENLPFPPEFFDRIYASHVIEHLKDPESFLREAYRVLKKGGFLEVWTPNFLSINARKDPTHRHVFNVLKLVRLGRKAGFKVYLPNRAGSRLPKPLQRTLSIAINLFLDELHITMEK